MIRRINESAKDKRGCSLRRSFGSNLLLLLACSLAACVGPAVQETSLTPPAEPALTASTPAASPISPNPPPSATTSPSLPLLTAPASPHLPTPTQTVVPAIPTAFPDASLYEWQLVAEGLVLPIGLANAGDGSGRLFVLEQEGEIRILLDGQLLARPFLDLGDRVGCCGERGLLGLAFHPRYAENGFFYVNYTDLNGDTVIARFGVAGNPNRANLASETILLRVPQPYPNHNGGSTVFGPDGYLYLGLGDGGSAGDPQGNAQNTAVLLGKILRLDVDNGQPYSIPPDNPFADGGGAPEVWAFGLRNPWRFSFDRLSGDLFIGDVGQGSWEEIDFIPASGSGGANFGWDYREGAHSYEGQPAPGLAMIDPVAEYGHDQGISVTGGVVYRGAELPEWQGIYLYGDYGSGYVWGLLPAADGNWLSAHLFETGTNITSFGEDEQGEVYLVDYRGSIFRLDRK